MNPPIETPSAVSASIATQAPTATEIQSWLVTYMASLLDMAPDDVDVALPFDRYGLDSAAAAGLTGDLADWLGRKLNPSLTHDYPTIATLAQHLANP